MSITAETVQAHANDPAVLCCRTEKGVVIGPDHLEDPGIFEDLVDSGLLEISDEVLTLSQVMGATMKETADSLTPLTPALVEGFAAAEKAPAEEKEEVAEVEQTAPVVSAAPTMTTSSPGMVKIHIGKGKDITLEFPLSVSGAIAAAPADAAPLAVASEAQQPEAVQAAPAVGEARLLRSLVKKHYQIDKVEMADETKIEGTTLYLRKDITKGAFDDHGLVKNIEIEIITKEDYGKYSETIMDVQPIATKEGDSVLGSGVTRVLDGVIVVVTGTDENGVQIGEFGSSEGEMDRNIMWNRPGAPDHGEIFIKAQVTIQAGTGMERRGPLAAHKAVDHVTQEIREIMKKLDDSLVVEEEVLEQFRRPGKKKVVIIKEIMGQGAMHDNLILPMEPVGVLGAKPNVDLGNLPVVLSPLEVLDGGIHALTCIGPASKENSRHYWREPLVLEAMQDEELDLCGVVFVGSPQINSEKFYVSNRLGMTIETMDVDGAFIGTEGFGNNHIDFASHHEQVGSRGIPVVGLSYCAVQGALVTGNEYMTAMIDLNKSKQGIENEILANNTLCHEDAVRAIAMLKAVMAGETIKKAERKWNPSVKELNVDIIKDVTGKTVELVDNEQVLEKSRKRREIYEVE